MMDAEDTKDPTDLFDSTPVNQEEDDGDIWKSAVGENNTAAAESNGNEEKSENDENGQKYEEPVPDTPPAQSVPPVDTEVSLSDDSSPVKEDQSSAKPAAAASNNIEGTTTTSGDGQLNITVVDPQKRGDGMGAFVVYKVVTSTTLPFFGGRQFEVFRRYSDFLGLYTKLKEKYAPYGRIVPHPPEKDMIGTTSAKFSKDQNSANADFINRRRCALERFMQRLGCNTLFRQDPDLRDFLTQTGDLPKATDTSALSTAGFKRLFSKVGNTLTGVVTPFDEPDPWFEERSEQITILENQLKKLVDAAESMQGFRHHAAHGLASLGGALRLLANAEENNGLSRGLSQLAEATERAHEIRQAQSEADGLLFAEQVRDYVHWLSGVKGVLEERCKAYRRSKDLETTLNKKREAKAKAELQSPAMPDKIQSLNEECEHTNLLLERSKTDCDKMSTTLREELTQFENGRAKDFVKFATVYLERQADMQQQIVDLWNNLLPEIKNIPTA